MALPFLCQVLYSILKIALEYVDLVLDIVCLKMYYEAWYRGDIPWWYWGLQALSLVLPPILMMIYWYKKTEKESVLKRSIAIVGLGLLHALVFPVAAFLKTFPAMQGYEAARHTEDQDMWRIRSLRLPTIMLEHFIQAILSWSYNISYAAVFPSYNDKDQSVMMMFKSWAVFLVSITSLLLLVTDLITGVIALHLHLKRNTAAAE